MARSKAHAPEALPRLPVIDTDSEFEALAMLDEIDGVPREGEGSGVQPVGQAWRDVYDRMRRAYSTGDFELALVLGERYLDHDGRDLGAQLCVEECRMMLETQLTELLSPLDRVVTLRLRMDELSHAQIDHLGAFLLSRIDGASTVEELLDVSGMSRVDTLRYLADWVEQGYIALT